MGACASSLTGWRLVEGFRALLTSEWLAGGWKVLHKCTMIPSCHFSYLLFANNLRINQNGCFNCSLALIYNPQRNPNNRKLHFELEHLVAVVMDSKQIAHS